MERKVRVKVFLHSAKNKKISTCAPLETVRNLLERGELKLVAQAMVAEKHADQEENNRNMCVAFMVSLIRGGLSKGWRWIKGSRKKGGKEQAVHNWLECEGFAVDASSFPGADIEKEENSILVMDAEEYRRLLGLREISGRNEKQVRKWLQKHKPEPQGTVRNAHNFCKPTGFAQPKTDPAPERKPVPEKQGDAEENISLDVQKSDFDDKKSYSEKVSAEILRFKHRGLTNTKIATLFIKKGLPTRSGRGSWSPRMVNEIFKGAANG